MLKSQVLHVSQNYRAFVLSEKSKYVTSHQESNHWNRVISYCFGILRGLMKVSALAPFHYVLAEAVKKVDNCHLKVLFPIVSMYNGQIWRHN